MLGLLIGRLGLSKADAMSLNKAQFEAVIKHGLEGYQDQWKRTRWLATVLVNISGKSVKRTITETELMRFENEKKNNGFKEFLKAHGAGHKE